MYVWVFGDRKVIYDVYSHVLLIEHIFADLAYSQGEHEHHTSAYQRIQHVLKGSIILCPWWQRGRVLGVAIKSKGGDCWHYDTSLALWHRCCPWWQLTDHSSGSQNEGKRDIRWFPLTKPHIHVGSPTKMRVCIYTHFHARKGAYMLENFFLVCGIWTMVFWPMVLVQGILSEVLTPGNCSKVLFLSGFGPWYWVRPKTIKGGGDH